MKKALSLLLALVLCLSLCACAVQNGSGSNSPATITDLSGNTVEMTAKELSDIYEENSAKFNKMYNGATITGVGTVDKVENLLDTFGNTRVMIYKITMAEGWELTVLEAGHDEVINLSKGDSIRFTSCIKSAWAGKVSMFDVSGYNASTMTDASVIEIIG